MSALDICSLSGVLYALALYVEVVSKRKVLSQKYIKMMQRGLSAIHVALIAVILLVMKWFEDVPFLVLAIMLLILTWHSLKGVLEIKEEQVSDQGALQEK